MYAGVPPSAGRSLGAPAAWNAWASPKSVSFTAMRGRRALRPSARADVAGLDVAVDHAARVRVRERVEQAHEDGAQVAPVERSRDVLERAAAHELHDQVRRAERDAAFARRGDAGRHLAVVEDPDDGGMVERGDGPDLVVEHGAERRVRCPLR
jgi:hypothetical protein